MALYDSLIGVATPTLPVKINKQILDNIYRDSAILLCDVGTILGTSTSIPVPLLGFTYETPQHMELLNYQYSDYTFLNKASITNAYIKSTGRASIVANRAITKNNGIVTNIGLNEAFYALLEKYCDKGGTFALLTMWGYYERFVLERLSIVSNNASVGGVGWRFDFKRYNKISDTLQAMSDTITSLQNGSVPK